MFDQIVTGKVETHLGRFPPGAEKSGVQLHTAVIAPLEELRESAGEAGFDVAVASGFRGFSRQLKIWNEKATGKRATLDAAGKPVHLRKLPKLDRVRAILRWSALPGASRHHWGTDFDVYDRKATPPGYSVQLTPEESDGLYGAMHRWLDANLTGFGFYRPYATERGGVSPERWHLSYAPEARKLEKAMKPELVWKAIADEPMELKEVVKQNLDWIFETFIVNVDPWVDSPARG